MRLNGPTVKLTGGGRLAGTQNEIKSIQSDQLRTTEVIMGGAQFS